MAYATILFWFPYVQKKTVQAFLILAYLNQSGILTILWVKAETERQLFSVTIYGLFFAEVFDTFTKFGLISQSVLKRLWG